LGALALDDETGGIQVDIDKCIGCGVCTLACPQETLKLHRFERTSIAFETSQEMDEAMRRENHRA
jgi:Fe-S-cluster-containing dehydrogenase component